MSSNGASSGNGRHADADEPAGASAPEQTLLEGDQTLTDADQTTSDADQTTSDSDQTASDSDQAASNDDQAESDRLFAADGDASAHDASRAIRDGTAARRADNAQGRLAAASVRDTTAAARDLAAAARDEAAATWDNELFAHDRPGPAADRALKTVLLRAVESRRTAAADRATAAAGRARAANDREQAARDRAQAAADRAQAARDRAELVHQLAISETDELTGARARAAGLAELEHEVDRANRTDKQLVVAFVDVIGLKAVNDESGHAAGDELLRCAVRTIRRHLRSYDIVVRLGGDEFLCVLSDIPAATAGARFDAIQAALGEDPAAPRIRVGLGVLQQGDTATSLVSRADAALPPGSRS